MMSYGRGAIRSLYYVCICSYLFLSFILHSRSFACRSSFSGFVPLTETFLEKRKPLVETRRFFFNANQGML